MEESSLTFQRPQMEPPEAVKPPEEKPKRKRRKITKSCAFCRKRKLRCDQKRPICSTCAVRGFTQCVYSNEPESNTNGSVAEADSGSHATFVDDLNKLQIEGEAAGGEAVKIKTRYISYGANTNGPLHNLNSIYHISSTEDSLSHKRNILTDFCTLQSKDSGRRICYGATAFKTFMGKYNWDLMQRFMQAWTKLKIIRRQLKKKKNFSMLKELCVAEEPIQAADGSPTSLINDLVQHLPSREKVVSSLNHFFDSSQLFMMNSTLDKDKVFRDFEQGFQSGDPRASDGEKPIVMLIVPPKKNYYKIGVIVMILALTYYRDELPSAVERFLIFLTGVSTAKGMYIERTQMLLLRCEYRWVYGHTGGDDSHLMLLVDNLISTATYLGLNRDIPTLYGEQVEDVGSTESLQKLWYWILFADLDIALNLGRPLKVSLYDYDDEEMLSDHSKTFYGVMKRFLKVVRPMFFDLHDRRITPDLSQHCETLIDFIEQEFPPISTYSPSTDTLDKGFLQTRILCLALEVLMAFYGLRFFALKEITPAVKNGAVKSVILSCSLCVNLILFCFELDKSSFPELIGSDCQEPTPYLNACLSHIATAFVRCVGMVYALSYCEMTYFENGLLVLSGYDETSQCDLSTLRSEGGRCTSFACYFKIACEKLDLLVASTDPILKRLLRRSRCYMIVLGLATVMRAVIERALESRTRAENSWLSSSCKHNLEGKIAVSRQIEFSTPFPERDATIADTDTSNCPCGISRNDPNSAMTNDYIVDNLAVKTDTEIGPDGFPSGQPMMKLSDQMESEMTQLIEEEFWGSYNLGWQELVENTDLESFFPDLVL
ncbi:hypothetical protein HG536_0A04240 [Torulaspora globosa]|uniref:Zn(2)-C6 fungal-type domain-containing protein n=1 Tax=Torulaspora globosa TaxID=48254 RepID=A0A7G3ZAS0_9SACH|nr:uncharacterized protein HG536_0A04240 [Torulaspora globosa]QLL30606.1 hypothetical protein HG536_0A04240 [Torulaspora globosa]